MKIEEYQHPDSVWTWKSNARGRKASLWIPYLDEISQIRGTKWEIIYNGGELEIDLKEIDTIMLYGASGSVPVLFLDQLGIQRIPMLVHRRNMDAPALVLPTPRPDVSDLLGNQVTIRRNLIKSAYVARTLVRSRFRAVESRLEMPDRVWQRFNRLRQLEHIRNFEARWARRYWKSYYANLDASEWTRRSDNPVSQALNACSFFLYGVMLRWTLLHRLSPQHGFLHRPTDYPSLIYDLIEPYRYIGERAVEIAVEKTSPENEELTGLALGSIKHLMDATVYVPMTRQTVRRKNLLHGNVLALRAWLLGEMKRFVIPEEGTKRGGRPPKVSYSLPGQRIMH